MFLILFGFLMIYTIALELKFQKIAKENEKLWEAYEVMGRTNNPDSTPQDYENVVHLANRN